VKPQTKQSLLIGQLANSAGVKADTMRFYDKNARLSSAI
jgi:DNA-binding transcriptional MerR regulator